MERTQSIENLVNDINLGKIVLPEFQRDFVWELPKTYDLFDSIAKEIFIGAVIYGIPSFEIAIRNIDDRARPSKGKKRSDLIPIVLSKEEIMTRQKVNKDDFRLVLDGQQRVTSIYRALTGVDSVWFHLKTDAELDDILTNKKFEECSLEELLYEFSGVEEDERLCIRLSDVWKIDQQDYEEDEIREKFFIPSKFVQKNKLDDFNEKFQFKRYRVLRRKLSELFKREKLLSHYLLDMGLDKFVLFFERSNTRGVQLNFIDILAAKLYPGNFNLKSKIKAFEQSNPNHFLSAELIVRTIAYIISKQTGKVVSVDRNFILSELNAEHFHQHWDNLVNYYRITLDYLYENNIIISQNWIPYDSMIIPLMLFVKELGGSFSLMNQSQKEFILFWYWNAIFSNRYSGASNERIIEDTNSLLTIANKRRLSVPSYFNKLTKTLIDKEEDIYSFNRKTSVTYKGILNLINYHSGGFIDWNNTSRLSLNADLEDHHIFPKAYLEKTGQGEEFADCVANRTLVPKKLNIKISDKKPSIYLNEFKNTNSHFSETLKNHLISEDLLTGDWDEVYDLFLEDRIKQIFALIKFHVIDKKSIIVGDHYEEPKMEEGGSVPVFAVYKSQQAEAQFSRQYNTIIYKGKLFSSPSSAAIEAKIDLGASKDTSENGWSFWKFVDEHGETKVIDDFRKHS